MGRQLEVLVLMLLPISASLALQRVSPGDPLPHYQVVDSTAKHASTPKRRPNLIGSGLRLTFPGRANQSYCLVSDPCVHINALLTGGTPQAWVKGYGIRAGESTLVLEAISSVDPSSLPAISIVQDNKLDSQKIWRFREDAESELLTGEAVDGPLAVEPGGIGRSSILVTVKRCNVRILVFVKRKWNSAHPQLSLDVLDWDHLDAPHGIFGQVFPNRADWTIFATASGDMLEEVDSMDTPTLRRLRGLPFSHPAQRESHPHGSSELAIADAVKRLYSLRPSTSVLDGEPEDYVSSGVAEADCIFSRFLHEDKTQAPKDKPWKPWGESLKIREDELSI